MGIDTYVPTPGSEKPFGPTVPPTPNTPVPEEPNGASGSQPIDLDASPVAKCPSGLGGHGGLDGTHAESESLGNVESPRVQAPKVAPAPQLSADAIAKRLSRIFKPRCDGSYQISQDFVKQFQNKGTDREALLVMFEKCNYEPDS